MERHPSLVYFSAGPASSTWKDLQKVTNDCIKLYLKSLPLDQLPILFAPFDIDDVLLEPDEIAEVIQGLTNGKSPIPNDLRAEYLKE